MHLVQWLVALFGPTLVAASSDTNYFTSPVSNTAVRPAFTLGDQLQVSWVTELGTFNVTFWQQSQVQESAASQGNIYCTSTGITYGGNANTPKILTQCSKNPC